MPPVGVFVIDDHPLVSGGVDMLLGHEPDMRVVGSAASVHDAVCALADTAPDLILLDLRMPAGPGSESVHELRRACPTARIVVFTAYPDHPAISRALAAGARGALLKDARAGDLARGVRRIMAGEVVVDPRLAFDPSCAHPTPAIHAAGLTDREYDVLCRVALGRTNPEIADDLGLARNTVKAYLQSCMQKLGARNRVEAIARAAEQRLL